MDISVRLENICKSYGNKVLFEEYNLEVKEGEFVAIMGESGRGKTTLLNIIAGLDKPDSGKVIINGIEDCYNKRKIKRDLYRKNIGFLFQNFALVDNDTVLDNLKLATKYEDSVNINDKYDDVLKQLGLLDKKNEKVYKLSGGEQQRVALARIMLKSNDIILADEPTGSLDEKNKYEVLNILKGFSEQGKTVIIVTHDQEVANNCDKILYL